MRDGVSSVTLWPHSIGRYGAERSIELAQKAGYQGIQALPMLGWSYKDIKEWEVFVLSYEDAWNYGSWGQAILRTFGVLGDPAPSLLDKVMFGQKISPTYLRAILSVHHFTDFSKTAIRTAVEVHPDLSISIGDYIDHVSRGGSLCWDTYHARRSHREIDDYFVPWHTLLYELPDYSIPLVHVHPTKEDTDLFMNVTGPTIEMLKELRESKKVSKDAVVILEAAPILEMKPRTIDVLGRMLDIIKLFLR